MVKTYNFLHFCMVYMFFSCVLSSLAVFFAHIVLFLRVELVRIIRFVASLLARNAHGEYDSYPAKGVIFV